MERVDLIATAQKLPQVSEKLALEFTSKRESLVEDINKRMEDRADLAELIGPNNLELMKDNHANHARFLESIFYQNSPETLVDTVLWVFRAYRARNFRSTYWSAQLNGWIEIYKAELSNECFSAVYPYYNWMLIHIPDFTRLADEKLSIPDALH